MDSETQNGTNRLGWYLLGAALVLAAASIGYNIYEGTGGTAPVAGSQGEGEPDLAQLRTLAEASSDDPRAWSNLAFAHFERSEFAAAAQAYTRALAIDDQQSALWSALGEALVMASARDPLPSEALAAFEKAVALDPKDARARYFLAVKKDLDKDHQGAIAAWLALLADTPPGAPWESDLVRTIEQVGQINGIEVAARIAAANERRSAGASPSGAGLPAVRGPSAAEMAAAGSMSPAEQREMAQGMVAQLEARLQQNPGNLDGWVMLIRSRMTLGEPAKAKAALEAAIRANPGEAAELRRQAEALGVK
ncbi:MAG: cytochrome C biogenesis protein CycH [Erythrobacter sp. SCN 62-14]|nr:MAG: cytochrome C biogenesis protein CycH [Erythrobacter sp. SCN 62-14]